MTATREQWSTLAALWDLFEAAGLRPEHLGAQPLAPPCLVVGSGLGLVVAGLARAGVAPVFGVDFSEAMARGARAQRGVSTISVADARALPFGDGDFGSAVCASGVLDRDNLASVAGELGRVVAPGGRVALAMFAPDPLWQRAARALGVLDEADVRQGGRLLALAEARHDAAEQAALVARYTGCSPSEARVRLVEHGGLIAGWDSFVDRVRHRVRDRGAAATRALLREALDWPLADLSAACTDGSTPAPTLRITADLRFDDVATRVLWCERARS